MENERERQREWEESQKETATRKVEGGGARGVDGVGGGIGGKWDVNRESFPLCYSSIVQSFKSSLHHSTSSSRVLLKMTLTKSQANHRNQNGQATRAAMAKTKEIKALELAGGRLSGPDRRLLGGR